MCTIDTASKIAKNNLTCFAFSSSVAHCELLYIRGHKKKEDQSECEKLQDQKGVEGCNAVLVFQGDVLENIELIQNLEKTKKITTEVSEKVALAKVTEEKLNAISEMYRPVARRGARLFFLLAQLFKIHSFYLFSMESFVAVINRAIDSISEVGMHFG